MKDKLLKIFNAKKEEKKELVERGQTTKDVEELRSCNNQLSKLNDEIEELRGLIDECDSMPGEHFEQNEPGQSEERGQGGKLALMNATQRGITKDTEEMEYRNAFMNYILKDKQIPDELRAATTSDAGILIPETILNRIVENLKSYGEIYKRVTITNVKGGVQIPTSSLKPTAKWTSEGSVATKDNKAVDGSITFTYHKLQVRVAITLEAETTTLSIFEDTIVENCYEAIIIAIEDAIINGTGEGQPLGITKDTEIKAKQKISIAPADIGKFDIWSKAFAKLPLTKRKNVVFITNVETFEGDLMGAVDTTGQPIARVNAGVGGIEKSLFKGKEAVLVEDAINSFDACKTGEVFAILINLKDYYLNFNQKLRLKKYFDEDTDEKINKMTSIVDGKLAAHQGVLLFTKGE